MSRFYYSCRTTTNWQCGQTKLTLTGDAHNCVCIEYAALAVFATNFARSPSYSSAAALSVWHMYRDCSSHARCSARTNLSFSSR